MTLPFIAIFLTEQGIGPVEIGLVIGVGPLLSSMTGVLGGSLTDKLGHRFVMLIALLFSAITFLFFIPFHGPLGLAVLNTSLGIFRSFFDTASKSYLVDLVPLVKRPQAFSIRYVAVNIGGAIGPFLGAEFVTGSIDTLFALTAMAYFITLIAYYFVIENFPISQSQVAGYLKTTLTSFKTVLRDKALIYITLAGLIVFFAFSQLDSTLPQVMSKRVADYIHVFSHLIALNAILIIVLQTPFDFMIHHFSLKKLAIGAVILFAISFVLFAFAHSAIEFYIAITIMSLGEIANVSLNNIISDRIAPATMKGAYFGAASFSLLGLSIGPFFGGLVLKFFGSILLFIFIASMLILCGYFYYRCYQHSYKTGAWEKLKI